MAADCVKPTSRAKNKDLLLPITATDPERTGYVRKTPTEYTKIINKEIDKLSEASEMNNRG